jgi:carboxyl-terminal processing protease
MLELVEDKHTSYFSPEHYKTFMHSLTGTFEGIGIWMQTNDEGHIIIRPITGSPAEAAGIEAGDRIMAINDKSTEGMSIDEAGLLIRGEPQTSVTLTILRDGSSTPFEVSIIRDEVVIPSVRAEEIEENIIYTRLYSFSGTAGDELIEGLGDFLDEDTTGIIIDLRDNPGGIVSDAILVSSQFLNVGDDVMHEVDGNDFVNYTYEASESEITINPDIRVAVLQNEGSASASEIVAGALQDRRNNTSIIGTTSYGKGSAQRILTLADGSAIKVTFTYWTTPNGAMVNGIGITPDITVEGDEAQLEAAINYVKNT